LFFLGKEELEKKGEKNITFCFISRALHQHSNTLKHIELLNF